MDGFTVKAADTNGAGKFDPVNLEVIGNIHAGDEPTTPIEEGQAIQIATGAPMPEGADAVVKVGRTELEDGTVRIYKPVHPSENVSPRGEIIEKGETILNEGDILSPSKIGSLGAIGRETFEVYRSPQIGIIPTGDEVIPLGEELEPEQIYDVNSYTLSSVVERNGGQP